VLQTLARLAIIWYQQYMALSISDTKKSQRGRGRPPTGIGRNVGLRLYPEQEAKIEAWINKQPAPQPSVPEAIRRLVEVGLAAPKRSRLK
jgi:hypothetical protein